MERVMMSEDCLAYSPVLKQMMSKIDKQVEVKPSSIPGAGQGLFARKPIKANSIVGFYPCHALGVEGLFVSSNQEDEDYFRANPSARSDYLHCTDQPLFKRDSLLYGSDEPVYLDVNPNRRIATPGWVSHFINDGARVEEASEDGVLEYYENAKTTNNCIHIPFGPSPILATISTKKIKKQEELFTTYGGVYWLGNSFPDEQSRTVDITPRIQAQIQATARTLVASMETANTLYQNQLAELQNVYEKLT
jgi:hypothetical protein